MEATYPQGEIWPFLARAHSSRQVTVRQSSEGGLLLCAMPSAWKFNQGGARKEVHLFMMMCAMPCRSFDFCVLSTNRLRVNRYGNDSIRYDSAFGDDLIVIRGDDRGRYFLAYFTFHIRFLISIKNSRVHCCTVLLTVHRTTRCRTDHWMLRVHVAMLAIFPGSARHSPSFSDSATVWTARNAPHWSIMFASVSAHAAYTGPDGQ